jgi:uncharacterized membrane protein YcaP (DUF421 family)
MEPYYSIIFRTTAVYFFIILAIRIFGKTQLAQLSVFDLVFILLISNSVQNAMVGPDSTLVGGLLASGSLFILNYIVKRISFRSKGISKILQGDPVMLVYQGEVLQANMDKIHLSMDELNAAIREHGVPDVKHVDLATLETDGNISVLSDDYKKKSNIKRKPRKMDLKKN